MQPIHHATAAACAALLAGPALAQETDAYGQPQADTEETMAMTKPVFNSIEEMSVGDLLGMVAYGPDGGRIGEIDYVVEAPQGGVQAVIGIGGFLGLGEYTVALPLSDFQLTDGGRSFLLSTDKATLKEQPEYPESTADSLPPETDLAGMIALHQGGDAAKAAAGSATMPDDAGTATIPEAGSDTLTEGTPDAAMSDRCPEGTARDAASGDCLPEGGGMESDY